MSQASFAFVIENNECFLCSKITMEMNFGRKNETFFCTCFSNTVILWVWFYFSSAFKMCQFKSQVTHWKMLAKCENAPVAYNQCFFAPLIHLSLRCFLFISDQASNSEVGLYLFFACLMSCHLHSWKRWGLQFVGTAAFIYMQKIVPVKIHHFWMHPPL